MPNANKSILIFCLSVFLLAGCSTKNVARLYKVESATSEELSALPSMSADRQYLSGSVRLTTEVDGEGSSLRGKIRVDSENGIQLGVVAMNMVEVACLEFYPDYARIIHKMEKAYSDVQYRDLPFFSHLGIDYGILEATLFNRVSVDGKNIASAADASIQDAGESLSLSYDGTDGASCRFFIEKATGNLVLAEREFRDGVKVVCRYSGFKPMGAVYYPHTIELSLEGADIPMSLRFDFGTLKDEKFDFSPRKIKNSYERLDVDSLMRLLNEV